MRTSLTTMETGRAASSSRASGPDPTDSTASPANSRVSHTASRKLGSSSTTRMGKLLAIRLFLNRSGFFADRQIQGKFRAHAKLGLDINGTAMGFNQQRGDTLSVANTAFNLGEKVDNSLPFWKDPDNISLGKDLLKYLVIGAIVAYILLAVVRPIIRTMFPPPASAAEEEEGEAGEAAQEGEVGEDGTIVELTGEGGKQIMATYEAKLHRAREVSKQDPKGVANIIKDWMGVNAG